MLNSGWSRLVPNVGRVTVGKKVSMLASAPKQSKWVVQEDLGGDWVDLTPPLSSYALAEEVMEESKIKGKKYLQIKEVL